MSMAQLRWRRERHFLDQRVVEWGFRPARSPTSSRRKPAGRKASASLRSAFRDRLPAEVFRRPKRGLRNAGRSAARRRRRRAALCAQSTDLRRSSGKAF
jgi:hypothetical protein